MSGTLATVSYIGATILFILSLGGLSNPETSRRGNLYGMIGMTVAVLATVLQRIKSVVGELGHIFAGGPDSEYATLLTGGILVGHYRLLCHVGAAPGRRGG